jgi:hypothetical protein
MTSFRQHNREFESWLGDQCSLVRSDIAWKHERMKVSPFIFLRATFFRWAKTIETICPECADAPRLMAVGDIHLENFGVWRDRDGRLVWGVNDFDEVTRTPCAFDLVRLATSALLSGHVDLSGEAMTAAILGGYRRGLASLSPVLLDRDNAWMRPLVMCTESDRVKFWDDIAAEKSVEPPETARVAMLESLPRRAEVTRFIRRSKKGGGALGKPRFAVVAAWRGGDVVREAKALTPSAWDWAHGKRGSVARGLDMARSDSRAPDPFLAVHPGYIVRRLAPDNRKIEFEDKAALKLSGRILEMMGQELGSLHGEQDAAAVRADLKRRKGDWLLEAAKRAAAFVEADYESWRG